MKRTTKYAALDAHQTTTSASVREDGGRVIARTILPTEEAPIVKSMLTSSRSCYDMVRCERSIS